MLTIPSDVFTRFKAHLNITGVPAARHAEYMQWLRYYLDFCDKYPVPDIKSERVRLYCEKLGEKKQSLAQRERAAHAVSLFYEMARSENLSQESAKPREGCGSTPITSHTLSETVPPREGSTFYDKARTNSVSAKPFAVHSQSRPVQQAQSIPNLDSQSTDSVSRTSIYLEAGYAVKSDSQEWDTVLALLAAEIKVRHYSRKTLQTYARWSRQFQRHLNNKPPQELSSADVKEYLTYLAVKCHVAASTQNQAFNALLFLYRHALKQDFGILRDVPRAKKSLYIPVVLSREEIDAILKQLSYPYNLVVNLLFGCGLRLFECLQLRVRGWHTTGCF